MSVSIKGATCALVFPAVAYVFPMAAQADEPPCYFESRSGTNVECGIYPSEISNTRAFLETVVNQGRWTKPSERAVILDVRSTPEYKAGHPGNSYNVPYPYIYQYCDEQGRRPDGACIKGGDKIDQNVDDFVSYVETIAPSKDTPIYTMCRTGVRSVFAANRLTEAGFTNVHNMWEGFVGVYLKAPKEVCEDDDNNPATPDVCTIQDLPVDLNHDNQLNDKDKNGWRYHLGLPYDTRLLHKLIYLPYEDTYDWE